MVTPLVATDELHQLAVERVGMLVVEGGDTLSSPHPRRSKTTTRVHHHDRHTITAAVDVLEPHTPGGRHIPQSLEARGWSRSLLLLMSGSDRQRQARSIAASQQAIMAERFDSKRDWPKDTP
jgi:hypothetical protein